MENIDNTVTLVQQYFYGKILFLLLVLGRSLNISLNLLSLGVNLSDNIILILTSNEMCATYILVPYHLFLSRATKHSLLWTHSWLSSSHKSVRSKCTQHLRTETKQSCESPSTQVGRVVNPGNLKRTERQTDRWKRCTKPVVIWDCRRDRPGQEDK